MQISPTWPIGNGLPSSPTIMTSVDDSGGRRLGQAIALRDLAAGYLGPLPGYGRLNSHAATDAYAQVAEVDLCKPGRMKQGGKQRIDGGKVVKLLLVELLDESREVARIRYQYVEATLGHHRQQVTLQREDVIKRQGGDRDDLVDALVSIGLPCQRLRNVVNEIAMTQHRTFRYAGRAAGVLQKCDVGEAEFRRRQRVALADAQRFVESA